MNFRRSRTHKEPSPLVRLWRHAGGHRRTVIAAIGFSVLNKLADVIPELLIGAAVDVVVREDDSLVSRVFGVEGQFSQLVLLAVINVAVWLVESASEFVAQVLWRNLAQTIEHEARMDAYRHVQRLELAWFEDQSTGGLLSILNDDVNQLERFLDIGANELIRTLVNVVFVGAVFFVAAPVLGVVAFLPIPVIIWGSIRYQRRLEPRYTEVRQAAGDLGALLANNMSGIATIRSFTAEDRESECVTAASGLYREANRRAIHLSSAFIPLIRMAILAAFTLTLLIGGRAALNGSLEVGVFSVLVYMTQRLLWPLTRLGETFDLYQRAMASTRRILDLLAVDPTIVDGPGALPAPVRGEVRFDGVRFAYGAVADGVEPDGAEPDGAVSPRLVLDGFDLVVPQGETHAIVGSTGAGKSTVVKLLLRLYDATGGSVTLDGVDVRDVPLVELRRAVGYVGQDVFLFQGTVRENLAYGRPDATDAELARAARLAEAHEFIECVTPDGTPASRPWGMPTFNEDVIVNGKVRIEASGDGAVLADLSSDRSWAIRQRGTDQGTALELASVGGGGNKNLIIATTGRVHVTGGAVQVTNRGDGRVLLHLDSERGWVFRQRGTDGGTALELTAANPNNNNKNFIINTTGKVGIGTTAPSHTLHVQGSVRVADDVILDGADCAEEFDIDPASSVAPGSVMVVGPARRLEPCSRPYDTRVAGVVSGAGDRRPGIVLGRRTRRAGTRRIPHALNGTVYAHVDATAAPIEVGDLLTTSDRPGCAMRASDPARAFGAILGKALDGLASGIGTVPVLVTLH